MTASQIAQIAPVVRDDASAAFFDATAEGRLLLRRCNALRTYEWLQKFLCARSVSARTSTWFDAAGTGHLESWVVMHSRAGADGVCPRTTNRGHRRTGRRTVDGKCTDRCRARRCQVANMLGQGGTFVRPDDSEVIPVFAPLSVTLPDGTGVVPPGVEQARVFLGDYCCPVNRPIGRPMLSRNKTVESPSCATLLPVRRPTVCLGCFRTLNEILAWMKINRRRTAVRSVDWLEERAAAVALAIPPVTRRRPLHNVQSRRRSPARRVRRWERTDGEDRTAPVNRDRGPN